MDSIKMRTYANREVGESYQYERSSINFWKAYPDLQRKLWLEVEKEQDQYGKTTIEVKEER